MNWILTFNNSKNYVLRKEVNISLSGTLGCTLFNVVGIWYCVTSLMLKFSYHHVGGSINSKVTQVYIHQLLAIRGGNGSFVKGSLSYIEIWY